ncbi:glycosyltransferase family protein [Sulfurimonas sp. HSL-1716]|uniref:glycosyltransferase family protein n=1 Tax=Hydrocurvibacter sulfurireducens TaxID=3131937 RepID=UPI0031F84280
MNLYIIIQARMTSTRLRAKVMLPLCGKTILEVMLSRLEEFKENIIVATTDDGSQMPIVELCKRLHVKYFQGDTDDVLARYYHSASKFGADEKSIIVRCTSDCPLIDAQIVKKTIEFYKNSDARYVCACQQSGFPRGMDTEVFSFAHLKEAYENAITEHHKEHVTPYIKENVKCASYKNSHDHSRYRLTLDEEDDYKAITELYEKLNCETDFSYEKLIETLEQNLYIYEMNKHVEQKKQ